MRELRRTKWVKEFSWVEGDIDRLIKSVESLPEDLEDYILPMVIVESYFKDLYQSLDINKVAMLVYEAVMRSKVVWQNVDYLEACRYIALNWDSEKCRRSKLRSVLPTRRGKTGVRPGLRGEGPMGKERGDQEQWRFPKVKLSPEQKKEIVATVAMISTEFMFSSHLYTFAGKTFRQEYGGPIGLRGTCAIARLVMQMWDLKWMNRMNKLKVVIWLAMRYMDDGRSFLAPSRPGWRWHEEDLVFCKRW